MNQQQFEKLNLIVAFLMIVLVSFGGGFFVAASLAASAVTEGLK